MECNAKLCPMCISSHLSKGHTKINHISEYCKNVVMKEINEELTSLIQSKDANEKTEKEQKAAFFELNKLIKQIAGIFEPKLTEIKKIGCFLEQTSFFIENTSLFEERKAMLESAIEKANQALKTNNLDILAEICFSKMGLLKNKFGDEQKTLLNEVAKLGEEIKNEKSISSFISYAKEFASIYVALPLKMTCFLDKVQKISQVKGPVLNITNYSNCVRDPLTGKVYRIHGLNGNSLKEFNSLSDFFDQKLAKTIILEIAAGSNYFIANCGYLYYQSSTSGKTIIKANLSDGKVCEKMELPQCNSDYCVIFWGAPSAIAIVQDESARLIYCLYANNDGKIHIGILSINGKMSLGPTKAICDKQKIGFILCDSGKLFFGEYYNSGKVNAMFDIKTKEYKLLNWQTIPGTFRIISHTAYFPKEKMIVLDEYYTGAYQYKVE